MRNMKTMKKHQYVRINTILLLLALSLLMISTNMFMIHARRRRRRNNMVDGTPSLQSKEVESLHNWPGLLQFPHYYTQMVRAFGMKHTQTKITINAVYVRTPRGKTQIIYIDIQTITPVI